MVAKLEIWGGIECTVNRVGDRFFDQLRRNGHEDRIDDLDRIAALGVRTLRYPVLWERVAPESLEKADWSFSDTRLARLRELGIRPIVGLVHHGSGPQHTSLVDPAFPEGLAAFARAVAERYPWIDAYTPVNEPLTTARFSGLYGIWYPHGRDDVSFLRALLGELRGTVLAMRAVRVVTPAAILVQTEDFGRTTSTETLAYQAAYENERRLLGIDLLAGRVGPGHPLYAWLIERGVEEKELAFFREAPCPPDILGINYYVTSDRYLDERLEAYPPCYHGGNGRHAYADVDTARVAGQSIFGHRDLLRSLWARYGIPLAITEAHLGGHREDQLRWFFAAHRAAEDARAEGIDVRAVTAWAMLGSFDWNVLVTREGDHYEPGAFDVRSPLPRPTAIGALVRELAEGRIPEHPALAVPGWWDRPDRILFPPERAARVELGQDRRYEQARPILITGASGTLGQAFGRVCVMRGLPFRLVGRTEMDIANLDDVSRVLEELSPWAVINAAGYVRVDDAELDWRRCGRDNVMGPAMLAQACREHSIKLVTFSSDLVFDGAQGKPYVESDRVGPLNVYGKSKADAERLTLAAYPAALVIRTAAFFGPWDEHNFVFKAIASLAESGTFRAADDLIVSPTYVPDLVNVALDLLIDGESGLWHLTNRGAVTWLELARQSAVLAGVDTAGLIGCPSQGLGFSAPRPPYCALGSERGLLLPTLEESLGRYVHERAIPTVHALRVDPGLPESISGLPGICGST